MIAQPLFFISNTLLHARGFCDGVLTMVYGGLAKAASFISPWLGLQSAYEAESTSKRATANLKSGLKGFLRSGLSLLGDAVIGGIAYGLALACSFIPGAQVLVPLLTGSATTAQAALGTMAVETVAAVLTTTTAVTAGSASVLQQKAAAVNIFKRLGIEPIVTSQPVSDYSPEVSRSSTPPKPLQYDSDRDEGPEVESPPHIEDDDSAPSSQAQRRPPSSSSDVAGSEVSAPPVLERNDSLLALVGGAKAALNFTH